MTVGDRNHLSSALRSAYRGAGLSHVLVVSGMHVSILCGDILSSLLPYEWEQSYRRRRYRAIFKALLAVLLAGVTGFTPSVCRAAVAVWVSALGVWVYGASDALTSLAAAGILMTARNSYAVCDIGFELSFAAVVGTVAGGAAYTVSGNGGARISGKNRRIRSGGRGTSGCFRTGSGVWRRAPASRCLPLRRPFQFWCCGG